MQVTFHLPVLVYGMPGRTTNKRAVVGYVPVVHDVPVLADHDAPIALEFMHHDHNGFDVNEALRGHEGTLLRFLATLPSDIVSVTLQQHGHNRDGLFADSLAFIASEGMERTRNIAKGSGPTHAVVAPPPFADFVCNWEQAYEFTPLSDMALKEGYEEQLNKQVDAFRRKIARLVIVDGRFYLPEPEPVFKLSDWHGDVQVSLLRGEKAGDFGIVAGTGRDMNALGYFRLDQQEEMLAEAEILAAGQRLMFSVRDVSVYDPSILVANTEAMTLAELAATFAQRFLTQILDDDCSYEEKLSRLGKALAAVPAEQIATYQRLVRGIDVFKAQGDASELEAAVFAVTESDQRSLNRYYFLYQGRVSRYADEITRRWNDREVSFERDFPMSPSAARSPKG
ncbi:hypothetical protein OIU34_19840 [Pararhizobium sp. BT-229]|uniref:hypothetical protein n=1 Tax=Pararhizobium sp. BT-229 TaxID=2986923 RepID=UPI0021F6DFBF|nr:hypothetical protein [Pararhizobium sp. BT-229]MCV9964138.1 hypothetical protein [Pararhizobium sp. BT-229]